MRLLPLRAAMWRGPCQPEGARAVEGLVGRECAVDGAGVHGHWAVMLLVAELGDWVLVSVWGVSICLGPDAVAGLAAKLLCLLVAVIESWCVSAVSMVVGNSNTGKSSSWSSSSSTNRSQSRSPLIKTPKSRAEDCGCAWNGVDGLCSSFEEGGPVVVASNTSNSRFEVPVNLYSFQSWFFFLLCLSRTTAE